MSRDHIDRVAGELWFIFGEYTDGSGCVDVNDGQDDVFERIPRDKAERLIKLRADFLAAVRAEYERPDAGPLKPGDPVPPCACGTVEAWHNPGCRLYPEGGYPADQPWRGPPREGAPSAFGNFSNALPPGPPINVVPLAQRAYEKNPPAYVEASGNRRACDKCGETADLHSVIVPLDTDPDLYDQLYTEQYCFRCAHAVRAAYRRIP